MWRDAEAKNFENWENIKGHEHNFKSKEKQRLLSRLTHHTIIWSGVCKREKRLLSQERMDFRLV